MGKAIDQLGPLQILANTTNPNVILGRLLSRCPFLCAGKLYMTGSAAGLVATITVGMTTIARDLNANAQNRIPVEPDDILLADFMGNPGDEIGIAVTNTTGGNLNVFLKMELVELELQY